VVCNKIVNFRFSLECPAKGSPTPEISWYKDDLLITPDSFEGISISGDDDKTLDIGDPQMELHSGYYHCKVSMKTSHFYLIFTSYIDFQL